MNFEIFGEISEIETVAIGKAICELRRLEKFYGKARWRKMKGVALIRLSDETIRRAELHWYETHGVGKKEFKRKRYLD
ncbi:MAG: hypothetical protein A3F68_11515 [Acidobacteria bacterium RIFCSPLOWO2_12_FULL_54_10]|nr:MAG: hypothetical protein A3F68_11515 [Acidobacteria bacterium RIFCSPLOWO2_12_FULL_54_10]